MEEVSFTIPIEHILQHNDISTLSFYCHRKLRQKLRDIENEITKWLLVIATNVLEKIVVVQHEVIMYFIPPPTSG